MEREQANKLVDDFVNSFMNDKDFRYPDAAALGACAGLLKETLIFGTDHAIKVMNEIINDIEE